MHAMGYHISRFLEDYQTIKLFTGQGVEKNYMARAIVLKKSNWDAFKAWIKAVRTARKWALKKILH